MRAMTLSLFQLSCFIPVLLVRGQGRTWASINVTVPSRMGQIDYMFSQVPILLGTPPQRLDLTIDLSSDLLAAWSADCVFCPGGDSFTSSASSTFQRTNKPWPGSDVDLNGAYVADTVGIAGIVNAPNTEFVLMETMTTNFSGRMNNGHLGLLVNGTDSSERSKSMFTKFWEQGNLLNPVIGLRLDPMKPKMTVGALDPADYDGSINWIQIESPPTPLDVQNAVKIDGIKGYNGSFLPFGDNLLAQLSTITRNIAVPPSNPYALNEGYTGPIDSINLDPKGGFAYLCNGTAKPYVALTVSINGIDYQIDSNDNMIHDHTPGTAAGYCNVALTNTTADVKLDVILGQPFLRSVYLAYRFPTADCPGYYGFAFPSGANRTQSQIDQKPKSTPTLSSQCLSLVKPTSTPTAAPMKAGKAMLTSGSYTVYGRPRDGQVALMAVDELPKTV